MEPFDLDVRKARGAWLIAAQADETARLIFGIIRSDKGQISQRNQRNVDSPRRAITGSVSPRRSQSGRHY
jgi:hypothetical protein